MITKETFFYSNGYKLKAKLYLLKQQENAEKLHPAVFCGIVCLLSKTSKVVL